jgi:hypothetical protein
VYDVEEWDVINWEELEDAINRAFDRLADTFVDLQVEELEAIKWYWRNPTKRKTGAVVGSPRDIIDTANLRDSLELTDIGDTHVRYEYRADYSGLVHQGFDGQGNAGTPESYPARPWVRSAYEVNDLLEIFADYLREELQ